MIDQFISDSRAVEEVRIGPIGAYMDRFVSLLLERGYARSTVKQKVSIMIKLNQWLKKQALTIHNFNEVIISKFIKHLHTQCLVQKRAHCTLMMFLKHLRDDNVIPYLSQKSTHSIFRRIQQSFSQYLIQERGLTQGTMNVYVRVIRQFLGNCFAKKPIQFKKLQSRDITRFILRHAYRMSPGYAKNMVYAIRAFLRFLHVRGAITTNRAVSVPTVANWRLSTVPETLEVKEIERILKTCDQDTIAGRRNYAILLLLARLGLRAGEVVNMRLDDIHWETGELIIHGKGNRHDKLPLPYDVGNALAHYIRAGRPPCSTRQVFIRITAPHQGFTSSSALSSMVKQALERAGIHRARAGPHLLRHATATRMLHKGISLAEISRILRHQSLNATLMYTKVDLCALRKLVQRWPGGTPCQA